MRGQRLDSGGGSLMVAAEEDLHTLLEGNQLPLALKRQDGGYRFCKNFAPVRRRTSNRVLPNSRIAATVERPRLSVDRIHCSLR